MPLTLSPAELQQTAFAVRVLTSPFDHGDVDGWRSAVNRQLRALLGADTAGFMLPVQDGLPLYSDEHDPAELARYTEYPPPPAVRGVPGWQRLLDIEVGTLDGVYGDDVARYLNSPYYNEYAAPNGAHDTLAMTVPVAGNGPIGMASLQFWHERPRGRRFGDREVELLRLLYPAFEAGIESWAAADRRASGLLDTIDELSRPAMVCGAGGDPVHVTPALRELLDQEADGARLRERLRRLAAELMRSVKQPDDVANRQPRALVRDVRTRAARYDLRAFVHRDAHGATVAIAVLEQQEDAAPSVADLRRRFGLTRRQADVALLLAERKTSREIGQLLFISSHTARHHANAVLRRLGLSDRRQVAGRIRAPG